MHALAGVPVEEGSVHCTDARDAIVEAFSSTWGGIPATLRSCAEMTLLLSFVWDCLQEVESGSSEAHAILRAARAEAPDLLALAAAQRRAEDRVQRQQVCLRRSLASATRAWLPLVPWHRLREVGFMLGAAIGGKGRGFQMYGDIVPCRALAAGVSRARVRFRTRSCCPVELA